MTRRIALAILVTVWVALIAGGMIAYFTTRSVLLADLDASLVSRAISLPTVVRPSGQPAAPRENADRWIVKDEVGRTLDRPGLGSSVDGPSPLIEAHFARSPEGRLLRTVTVGAGRIAADGSGETVAANVVYTGSADEFEVVLRRLAEWLGGFGLVAGLLAAGIAVRVSRIALRPLRSTADQIGGIDEQHLDRRIPLDRLPPELLPMAHKLNDMLGRLQEAFELRRQFLAAASHELRTPVAALMTTLEVSLARPRTTEAYRQTLETCLGDATLLRRLVERLMEQVRSETLSHDEPSAALDVGRLLSQCAAAVEPLAAAKDVRIFRDFPPAFVCEAPRNRLRSVVMNLLGNAIDYNRAGGRVELRGSCNGNGLKLTVSDTGIGIAAEDLPNVFEPFFRADASRRQDAGHLGLGLSLVRAHVRAMGGDCRVESTPGEGTTFHVRLPEVHEISQPM